MAAPIAQCVAIAIQTLVTTGGAVAGALSTFFSSPVPIVVAQQTAATTSIVASSAESTAIVVPTIAHDIAVIARVTQAAPALMQTVKHGVTANSIATNTFQNAAIKTVGEKIAQSELTRLYRHLKI